MAATADNIPAAGTAGNTQHAVGKQGAQADVEPQPAAATAPLHREEALVAIGRRVVTAPAVDLLLQDAAQLLADAVGMEHYAVAEVSPDQRKLTQTLRLVPLTSTGKTNLYRSQGDHDPQTSLAGYAIAQGQVVFSADLRAETAFEDSFLRQHKVHCALAVPLRLQGQVFGALVAASSRARKLDQRDLLLAETSGHLVAATVGRLRAEEEIARRQRVVDRLLETVDALVMILDEDGRVIEISRAAQKLTGFGTTEVCGRRAVEVFLPPDEKPLWAEMWEQLRRGRAHARFTCQLIDCNCRPQTVHWSCSATRNPDGTIHQVIVTGTTTELQAEQERASPLPAEPPEKEPSADADKPSPVAENGAGPAMVPRPRRSKRRTRRFIIPSERRRKARRAYPYLQRLAPVLDDELPNPDEFIDVECHDISPGGFSFLFPYPFPSDSLVVELGIPPKLTYLMAQVAHVTRTTRGKSTFYLIGCNYTHRVRY